MNKTIYFHNFEVQIHNRELFFNDRKVNLQKKSFDLLLYLIENRDRAVSKDELIETLWQGRVVSDSVLSHASSKLRTALNDNNGRGAIIRTVHGFGLQFVAVIQDNNQDKAQNNSPSKVINKNLINYQQKRKNKKIYILAIAIIILAIGSIYLFKFQTDNPIESQGIVKQQVKQTPKINYVVSNGENQDQWMVQGLTAYLNHMLSYSENSMPIDLFQTNNNSSQNYYALNNVINTNQINNDFYLTYKENDIVQSELKVTLNDLPQAIKQINQWVCTKTLIENKNCQNSIQPLTNNSAFIIENYIRGKAAMINLSPKNAINLFTVCLQQAPDFVLARMALSEAYLQISEHKKSISTALTVIETSNNQLIQQHAYILLGKAYFEQSKFEQSEQALLHVIDSNNSNQSLKAMAMLQLSLVKRDADNLHNALELAQDSQLIFEKLNMPIQIAHANDAIGFILMTQGELEKAQQHLTESLRSYEQLQDYYGVEKALSSLGLVTQQMGEIVASLEYAKQRQEIAKKIGDPKTLAATNLQLANLYLEMGDLDQAYIQANAMWDLVIKGNDPHAILSAYSMQADVANAQENYRLAIDKSKMAIEMAADLGIGWRQTQLLCTTGAYAIDGGFYNESAVLLEKCHTLATNADNQLFQSVSQLYFGSLYKQQNNHAKAKIALEKALLLSKKLNNNKLDFEIYLEFFNITIDHDIKQAQWYLQQVPDEFKDDFIYLISLAEIEYLLKNYSVALQIAHESKLTAGDSWSTANQQLLNLIRSKVN